MPDTSIAWRPILQRRLVAGAIVFGLWAVGIETRLAYLQIYRYDELRARAERQQMRTIDAAPKRGEILDRHGRVLAFSVDTDSIYAVPTEIENPQATAAALCDVLDGCTGAERQTLAERLSRQRAFAYVRRQVSPDQAKRVAALGLRGVGFIKENRRFYPKRELAAHLLGFVGTDSVGLGGIEAAYDRHIRGQAGTILIQLDARGQAFSRLERKPTVGATLELTIDEYLQHVAERELRAGVRENRAAGGTVIVMDPRSGEILALANEPTFNPNVFLGVPADHRRNRAVQDLYEPGSTFKIITASAALEERVVGLDDLIDVGAGLIRFGSRVIDDDHRYGVLPFTDVIVKSSNVGAIKVGMKLGAERLSRYVRRFGFGRPLSPDFPGENPGIVWDASRLDDSALASVSMGYQVGVTPLQMAAAVSSVANGGSLIEPRVVRAIIGSGRRRAVTPRVIRRTIAPQTVGALTTILEAVVERGTARAAAMEGYPVAGKTGTAAKVVNGRYSTSDWNASFVGFVPSRAPAVTIVVVIDSPRDHGHYGGIVAAPIFKRVAELTLRHLGLGPTINPSPPVLVARRPARPEVPIVGPAEPAIVTVSAGAAGAGGVPDLRGLSAREATRALTKLGILARLSGVGFVVEQDPPPGAALERGASCRLRLERAPLRLGRAPAVLSAHQ